MTTYYISPYGSNSNNGLGPDPTHATNKPWLTVGKSMNSGSPVSPGDVVYIAPGYYWNETIIPIAGIASSGSPTMWVGDPTNSRGFKDAFGVRIAPGQPVVTTRQIGDGLDTVISSARPLIDATAYDPSGLQFYALGLEARHSVDAIFLTDSNGSSNILFDGCFGAAAVFVNYATPGMWQAARNITVRNSMCITYRVFGLYGTINAATPDADLNLRLENSLVFGRLTSSVYMGNGGNNAGGVYGYNNTIINITDSPVVLTVADRVSTVNPIKVGGNLIISARSGAGYPFNAATSGHIVDDGYNRIINMGPSSGNINVTPAGTTTWGAFPNLVLPHLAAWGLEMPRIDFLGWTDAALEGQKFSASSYTTTDFRGRTPRPWGAGASIGCWQAPSISHDISGAITAGGSHSLKLTGAGELSFYMTLNAGPATISVTTKSTGYGGTNYPQLVVMANPTIGVATTTATATDTTEQVVATSTITPTGQGVVEVRLISRSSSTTSSTYFDLLAVT